MKVTSYTSSVTAVLLVSILGGSLLAQEPATTSKPPATTPATSEPAKELTLDLGNKITLKLALIPAGKFLMGSPDNDPYRKPNEGPQHEVTISLPFYMSIYTVTQEQYEAVMGSIPSPKPGGQAVVKGATLPVHPFTYENITDFCQKLSEKTGRKVRLNTEAEWEYVARAGTQTTWPWGNNDKGGGDYGWFQRDDKNPTHPVGLKKPNPWGIYDLAGNVAQVCSDWGAHYPKETDANYTKDPVTDPTGPATGEYHISRGAGGWAGHSRSAGERSYYAKPEGTSHHPYSFRIIVELPK